LIQLIEATPKNSSIYFMVYLFDDTALQNALIAANSRGAKVNVIIDWSTKGSADNASAYAALNGNVTSITKVINPLGIVHNKLALFTDIQTTNNGVQKNIIFESSSNFMSRSYKKFQDAIILQDETLFVDGFMAYWNFIIANNTTNGLEAYDYRNQLGSVKLAGGSSMHKAYFYPKRKNGKNYGYDTAALILGHVITGSNSAESSADIKLAMSLWSKSRETEESPSILSNLKTIASNSNNTIEIIIPNKSTNEYMIEKLETLAKKNTNVTLNVITQNLHSKYMLVNSSYGKQGSQQIVFSGSENFTRPALRSNFETWIKYISDASTGNTEIYDAYSSNFQDIKTATPQ